MLFPVILPDFRQFVRGGSTHYRSPGTPGRGKTVATLQSPWAVQAACRDADPNHFYPPEGAERRAEREALAKRICAECVVRGDCLEQALTRGESYGIWGGLNEVERRSLLRRR